MSKIEYDSYSYVGGREENEDSAEGWKRPLSGKHCFVVCDGLGGHGGGQIASSGAIACIKKNWNGSVSGDEWARLSRLAHEEILTKQTDLCRMKTTLVGLMLHKNKASWVHVGDSRLYHFYKGKLVFQTRDHSASQLAVMLGEITQEEIRFHEARNRVLRALGQSGDLNPECAEEELGEGKHVFLLCTDGFWEYVTEKEMWATLRRSKTPKEWINRMRTIHNKRIPKDNDNNTAIAIFLNIE